MAKGIRSDDLCRFNKGLRSKFPVGSRVRQTPEESWRTYRQKRCGNYNKDEDNSPKILNDKNHQASSRKFWQLLLLVLFSFWSLKINDWNIKVYPTFFYGETWRGAKEEITMFQENISHKTFFCYVTWKVSLRATCLRHICNLAFLSFYIDVFFSFLSWHLF